MQSTNRPAKFLVPFAQNDSARVELPATTPDSTRASQSLGFPPATGLPPEAGGVPPQLEDMNGGLNQISRGVWWALGGGRYPYDSAWANDSLIGGYARGAVVPAALGAGSIGMGEWYNNAEGNAADPDTSGTGWVPGYHYGITALSGLTGGTVTLTPAQAAKRTITLAGTLTSNLVLVLPAWVYDWSFVNSTAGAFTVTVKTASGAGTTLPQDGNAVAVRGNGTDILANAAAAGRMLRTTVFTRQAGTQVMSVDGSAYTSVGATTFVPLPASKRLKLRVFGGGGGGGGAGGTGSGQSAAGSGGGAGGYSEALLIPSGAVSVTVGAAGLGAAAGVNNGGAGGTSTFATVSASGGAGGLGGTQTTLQALGVALGGGAAGGYLNAGGAAGGVALILGLNVGAGGVGASSALGGGGTPGGISSGAAAGNGANAAGAGGGGAGAAQNTASGAPGGVGGAGFIEVIEYA